MYLLPPSNLQKTKILTHDKNLLTINLLNIYIYTPSSGRLQMQPKDLRQDNLCTAIIIDIGVIVRSRSGINIGEV